MPDNKMFEIPQSLRDASDQNLKQAHAAYDQFMQFVSKAIDGWMGAIPANPMTSAFKTVQGRAMDFAKENAEKAFGFAGKISSAQSMQEVLSLQTEFAQELMQTFVGQTQQLFSVLEDAAHKQDFTGVGAGATATAFQSSPILSAINPAAFKEAQEQAVTMAKKNADAAFSLVEKMSHVQNFQDLFSLQTRFAQDQIQSYAAQTQDVQRLMANALKKA